jgi:response regulator RpfG family c-di-GMP phosphodiesterase
LLPAGAEVLPFAALGFLLGRLYLSLGPAVMLLIIVPILIAREMFASYLRVKESHDETVGMLIHALEAKDRYTSGHSERVADYARYIGEELNFLPARLERLRFAALMHDIGKLVVPNHLLNKPGRLTPDEFSQVRVHEKVSVQMLSHIDFLRPIAAASHSDATRFDPDDLDHPIEPYIVMIADAYDAMTSTRAYRKALPQEVAFQELRDKAGIQFHPACVEALIRAVEKRGEKHGDGFERDSEFDNAPVVGLGSAGLGDLLDSEPSQASQASASSSQSSSASS